MKNNASQRADVNIRFLPNTWPDADDLAKIWPKYRNLRLQALQLSPKSYASTYEQEIEFAPEVWMQRLQNPAVQHIIATRNGARKIEDSALGEEEWVGLIVVHRKKAEEDATASKSPWTDPSDHADVNTFTSLPGIDPGSRWYQLNAMFVHPSARRQGLGKMLIEAGLAWIRNRLVQSNQSGSSVVVLVDSWNEAAIALYKSTSFSSVEEYGFVVAGEHRKALKMSQVIYQQDF